MASTRDPKKFKDNIMRRGKFLVENAAAAVRATALAADTAAVLNTPVLTGRARSNWIITAGAPAGFSNTVFGASENRESNRAAATATALGQGRKAVVTWNGQGALFLTNNINYIGLLDAGSSKQAPFGITPIALLAATNTARKFKDFLEKK